MNETSAHSEEEIERLIGEVLETNFVVGGIARMVYDVAFHQDEIREIRIKHVLDESGQVGSQIEPFLAETTKAYKSMPKKLEDPVRDVLGDHIRRLGERGLETGGEAPLFPNMRTKKAYIRRTLINQFEKLFPGITMTELRKLGMARKKERLQKETPDPHQVDEKLSEFAGHSRLSTTRKFMDGKVDEAGRSKKPDLPWEIIVRSIEGLERIEDVEVRKKKSDDIEQQIEKLGYGDDIKDSLRRLLYEYNSRLSVASDVGSKSAVTGKSLSEMISEEIIVDIEEKS